MSDEAHEDFAEDSYVELSGDEAFAAQLVQLLRNFSLRQSEVLRMSEFVAQRSEEIDDARQRAKRIIIQQYSKVEEEPFEKLLQLFQELSHDADLHHDELPDSDKLDAIQIAFREIVEELPEEVASTYATSILSSLRPSVGIQFLHSSLLVTLVGELEMLVNQLARLVFEFQPSALGNGERSFTWKEISGFSSMDEFRDHVVDRTVEDLLRGSLTKWVEFFENRFSLPKLAAARRAEAIEAVQRRHCIVHNAGTVSQQYLDNVSKTSGLDLDDELIVDADYLKDAADNLFLVGYSLIWAIGMKFLKEEDARYSLLHELTNRTMFLIQEGRYSLVILIGGTVPHEVLQRDERSESCSLTIKVNYWLAHKEAGRFDEVRQEVEDFPVITRSDRFKMAKEALLGNVATAHTYVQRLLSVGELKEAHVLTWPLLREVRDFRNEPKKI